MLSVLVAVGIFFYFGVYGTISVMSSLLLFVTLFVISFVCFEIILLMFSGHKRSVKINLFLSLSYGIFLALVIGLITRKTGCGSSSGYTEFGGCPMYSYMGWPFAVVTSNFPQLNYLAILLDWLVSSFIIFLPTLIFSKFRKKNI